MKPLTCSSTKSAKRPDVSKINTVVITDKNEHTNRKLSSSTLAALQEFYTERDSREKEFAKLQARAEAVHDAASGKGGKLSMDVFAEDWNESQFWVGFFWSLSFPIF